MLMPGDEGITDGGVHYQIHKCSTVNSIIIFHGRIWEGDAWCNMDWLENGTTFPYSGFPRPLYQISQPPLSRFWTVGREVMIPRGSGLYSYLIKELNDDQVLIKIEKCGSKRLNEFHYAMYDYSGRHCSGDASTYHVNGPIELTNYMNQPVIYVDWGKLEPWVDIIAMDSNGDWHGYAEEILPVQSEWLPNVIGSASKYLGQSVIKYLPMDGLDWKLTKRYRPKSSSTKHVTDASTVKEKQPEPLDIDILWHKIPEEYNFVAMDSDGEWNAYTNECVAFGRYFWEKSSPYDGKARTFDFLDIACTENVPTDRWKETKRERPKNMIKIDWDKIPSKFDCIAMDSDGRWFGYADDNIVLRGDEGNWWIKNGCYNININHIVGFINLDPKHWRDSKFIRPKHKPKLDIDWSKIPDHFKWATHLMGREAIVFTHKPLLNTRPSLWYNSQDPFACSAKCECLKSDYTGTVEESLTQRPGC